MAASNSLEDLSKTRRKIAAKVRELRQGRRWTLAELARQLQLSPSRLSEIERGDGSFTAEQFLLLSKLFNVTSSDFVVGSRDPSLAIQNALARLGAAHIQESVQVLPSMELEEAHDVVREGLLDGSPRIITALAPVLASNAERLNLGKLYADLETQGRGRRLAWVIENTLDALSSLSRHSRGARTWAKLYRRAALQLRLFLDLVAPPPGSHPPVDILDATIRSKRTLEEVQRAASKASQRWGIATSLQLEDFIQALTAAHAAH
jgi:transcriptional regulator with XRE-family HTH domain